MIESLTQVQILSTNTFVRLKGQLQDVDNNVYEICIFNDGLYIYIITNWTCNCTLYNTIVLVVAFGTLVAWRSATRTRFGTLVAGRSATRMLDGIRRNKQFWSNLNCKFDFFLRENVLQGRFQIEPPLQIGIIEAADTTAAPTNRFVGAVRNTSRPYKSICRSGSIINRPYKSISRSGS